MNCRWNEVGQRLPHARAGLDHQVATFGKHGAHRLGHLALLGAFFKPLHNVRRRIEGCRDRGRGRREAGFAPGERRVVSGSPHRWKPSLGCGGVGPFGAADHLGEREVIKRNETGELEAFGLGEFACDPCEGDEDRGSRPRVRQGAMVNAGLNPEAVRQANESALFAAREEETGEMRGVYPGRGEVNPLATQAAKVEVDVLANDRVAPCKGEQLLAGLGDRRRAPHRCVRDAGQRFNEIRNLTTRIDQRFEDLDDFAVGAKAEGADLRNTVGFLVQASGLEVKGNKGIDHGENIRANLRSLLAEGD